MSPIEKEVSYKIEVPADLMEFDIMKEGSGVLNEKAVKDFYLKLRSWAAEIAKAVGIFEPSNDKLHFKKPWGAKKQTEILNYVRSLKTAVSPTIVSVHCKCSKRVALKHLDTLANQGKIDRISIANNTFCSKPEAVVVTD